MEHLTVNISGKVRQVNEGGKSFLVAPLSLIVPGVLSGSKGSLLYEPSEIARNYQQWNGMPLLVYHPHDPITNQPLSAQDPDQGPSVIEKQGVGEVRNTHIKNGKLRAEGWFDVEKTTKVDPRILANLKANRPCELSTGLFTDNEDTPGNFRGRPYTQKARNYRADHVAILPDQVGACSIKDGCGVLVNQLSLTLQEKLNMLTDNADDDEGRWVTLPNGVHIQVKDGDIVKGPKVGSKEIDKKTPVKESSEKKSSGLKALKQKAGEEDDSYRERIGRHIEKNFKDATPKEHQELAKQHMEKFKTTGKAEHKAMAREHAGESAMKTLHAEFKEKMKDPAFKSAVDAAVKADQKKRFGNRVYNRPLAIVNSSLVINPDWVEDHDIWEKAKAAADKSDYDDDSYYAVVTSIYKNMGGGIKESKMTKNQKLYLLANSNPEGINQYSKTGSRKTIQTEAHEDDMDLVEIGSTDSAGNVIKAPEGVYGTKHKDPYKKETSFSLDPAKLKAAQEQKDRLRKLTGNQFNDKLQVIANSNDNRDELGRFASGSGGGSKGSGKGSAKVHGAAKEGHKETGLPERKIEGRKMTPKEAEWRSAHYGEMSRLDTGEGGRPKDRGTQNMADALQDKLSQLLSNNSQVDNADVKEDDSVTKLKQANGSQTPLAPISSSEQETKLRLRDGSEVGSDELDTEDHDMIEEGAESPLKSDATALGAEEIKLKPFKKPEQRNAQTHNQEEGGHTMATVTLNAEEREAVVNGLIEGECCFEESERQVLNSLSDRTLARLTLNAKEMPKFIQDKIDAKKKREEEEGSTEEEPEVEEDEEVENDDQKTKEEDKAGLGVRAGKGTGKNESQAQGNVKPCGELNPKMPTDNQLSADDRQFLAIGRKVVSDRRSSMIKTITANSRNPFDKKELDSMEFNQLEKLSQLAAVENEAVVPSFTLNRFSGFMGAAAGVGQVNNDSGVDDDVLETPTINYSEIASKGIQKR